MLKNGHVKGGQTNETPRSKGGNWSESLFEQELETKVVNPYTQRGHEKRLVAAAFTREPGRNFTDGKRDHVQMLKLRHPGPSHFLPQGAIIEGQPAIFPILISKCLYKQEDSYKGSSQSSIVL